MVTLVRDNFKSPLPSLLPSPTTQMVRWGRWGVGGKGVGDERSSSLRHSVVVNSGRTFHCEQNMILELASLGTDSRCSENHFKSGCHLCQPACVLVDPSQGAHSLLCHSQTMDRILCATFVSILIIDKEQRHISGNW